MRTPSGLALTLAASLLASSAAAQPAPSAATIVRALSGFEEQPGVDAVRAWGLTAVPALIAVADDADEVVAVRARAAYALRAFGADPAARGALRRMAADAGANVFVRRAAIDALIDGGDDVAGVAAQLSSPDPDVRAGVAGALARSRQVAAARAALDGRARVETEASVRRRIAEALRAMPAR